MINHDPQIIHATCVGVNGAGLLIVGPSGSGKSGLALQLIALGARLVADDRCQLYRLGDQVIATKPPSLPAGIESRGIGIIAAPMLDSVALSYVVDMGNTECDRYPPARNIQICDVSIPLILNSNLDAFAASLYLLMINGFAIER